jgi:hypothetical protein
MPSEAISAIRASNLGDRFEVGNPQAVVICGVSRITALLSCGSLKNEILDLSQGEHNQ